MARRLAVTSTIALIVCAPAAVLAQAEAPPAGAPDLGAPPGVPSGQPAAAPPAVPDLRPRIYVKDLDHLAELVKADPAIYARARSLSTRRTTALGVGGALLATGLVVSLTGMGNERCHAESFPFPGSASFQVCEMDPTQSLVGAGIALAGVLAGAIIAPGPGDFLDVINSWNTAHPDRPFELHGGHHPMLDQVAVPAPASP